MIRVEKGTVEMRGMVNEIQTDLAFALKTFRANITEMENEETADEMIEDIVKMSKKKRGRSRRRNKEEERRSQKNAL